MLFVHFRNILGSSYMGEVGSLAPCAPQPNRNIVSSIALLW